MQEVPLLGNLFKSKDDKRNVSELVIFLRATILDNENNVTEADESICRNFTPYP